MRSGSEDAATRKDAGPRPSGRGVPSSLGAHLPMSNKRKTQLKRKYRRRQKAVLKFGPCAKRRHARVGGRTGKVRQKQLAGLKKELDKRTKRER